MSLNAIRAFAVLMIALSVLCTGLSSAQEIPGAWQREFPKTDFRKSGIDFSEILSGGPSRDGIPSIDDPRFLPVSEVGAAELADREPVISAW